MKRKIAFLLLFILFLQSCGTALSNEESPIVSAQDTGEQIEEPESVPDTVDEVPEMKFGEEFNIYIPTGIDYSISDIVTEDILGERVNDAQYNMKLHIEDRFDTEIVQTYGQYLHDNTGVTKLIQSNDDTYELFYILDLYVMNFVGDKMVIPYDDVEYIDLSKAYWDQSLNEYIKVGKRTYFAFGASDLSYYDLTHVLVFNKNLISNLQLDNPYNMVSEGKWTYDQFYLMAQTATQEVDGDGRMTEKDSYGFVSVSKQVPPNFWIAAGVQCIAKDSDNLPYLNFEGNDQFYAVFDWLFTTMWDGGIWCHNTEVGNYWSGMTQIFSDDRALFAAQTFHYLNNFRDVESDFGIIPYPKYNEEQKTYHSRVEGGCKMPLIPVTNKHVDFTGAILEAMNSYAYNNTIPEYYEVALKRRNSRDAESEEMLDLIFSTRTYDFADTWWCNDLRDGIFAGLFMNNNRSVASSIAQKEKIMVKKIKKTAEAFMGD